MQDLHTVKTNSWLQLYGEFKKGRYIVKLGGTDLLSNYGKLEGTLRRYGMKEWGDYITMEL